MTSPPQNIQDPVHTQKDTQHNSREDLDIVTAEPPQNLSPLPFAEQAAEAPRGRAQATTFYPFDRDTIATVPNMYFIDV